MATSITNLKDRAVAWSSANGLQSLVSDTAEIINRVAADERALFDLAAATNSYYFATTAAVTSSSGSSARTITTTALTPPVGRILRLVLTASGTEVNQVDVRDQDAELSPRYFLLGTVLTEVSNDWSATSGTVAGTLTYVKRPTVLSTTGALSQTITLPDEFADLLEMKLAYYIAHKDYGREQPELVRLEKMIQARTGEFVGFLQSFGGTEARRFNIPSSGSKR